MTEKNGIEAVRDVELSFHNTDESYFNTVADTGTIAFVTEEP